MRLDNRAMSRDPRQNDHNIIQQHKANASSEKSLPRPILKEEAKNGNVYPRTESSKKEGNGIALDSSGTPLSHPPASFPPMAENLTSMPPIMPHASYPFLYRPNLQPPYRPIPPFYAPTVPPYPYPLGPNGPYNPHGNGCLPAPFAGRYPRQPFSAFMAPPPGPRPFAPSLGMLQMPQPENSVMPAPGDASLGSLDDPPKKKNLLSGKAYKSRNVYKSIVRHLFSYIRKNREDIIRILREVGFTMTEIEHSFFKINYYNDLEREQSNKKNSQATIKKMVSKRTIYTYILRETVNTMLHNWEEGKLGKVSESNSEVYKDVCRYFYDEAIKITGQPAQGRTFYL